MRVQVQGSAEEEAQQAVLERLAARKSGQKQQSEEVVTPGIFAAFCVGVSVAAVYVASDIRHHVNQFMQDQTAWKPSLLVLCISLQSLLTTVAMT